ncbi:hypothetical protein ACSBR1_031795 [Camellia fascicularis]
MPVLWLVFGQLQMNLANIMELLGCEALKAFENKVAKKLHEYFRKKLMLFDPQEEVRSSPTQFEAGTYVESPVSPNCSNMIKRSLQAQMEACEAQNKTDLSKAKRYRLDE